jgi:homoserine O-acetyltransferase
VQSYLHHQGKKLVDRFDANTYVRLSESANTHDVARGRGEYDAVLASLTQPTLVVGVDSDVLFPLREQEELARLMPHAELAVIESEHGHDGFLLETPQLGALLRDWLHQCEQKIEEASCVLT